MLAVLFLGLLAASPTPVVRFVSAELRNVRGAQIAGRPSAVLQALTPILALEPDAPRIRLAAADAALNLGQPGVALDHLHAAGLDGQRWKAAGCVLVRAQVASGAVTALGDVLDRLDRFCPSNDPAWRSVVAQAQASGDMPAASRAARAWAEADPADPEAHYYLGLSLALVDPPSALSPLKTAQALSPSPSPLTSSLAQAIEDSLPSGDRAYEFAQVGQALARTGRWDLAAKAFSQAVELSPGYVEARAYLGLALDRTGGDGQQELIRASQSVPSASLPHVFLAQHWALKGEQQKAVQELRIAQSLQPDSPAIAAQLGGALVVLGDLQSALLEYQHAVELAPSSAEFQSLLAAFSLDHEIDVAGVGLPAARQAVLLEPTSADYIDQLGFSYYLHGNPEMAEHLLGQGLRADPVSPAINYHLGLARLALQKTDLAVMSLRQAAALDPGGMYAMLATRTLSRLQP
jgi:tetratricopeptide (TPR) repeat protein